MTNDVRQVVERQPFAVWLVAEIADAHAEYAKQTTEVGQQFYNAEIMALNRVQRAFEKLTAQPSEVERLTMERDEARRMTEERSTAFAMFPAVEAERDKLLAEVERLKAELADARADAVDVAMMEAQTDQIGQDNAKLREELVESKQRIGQLFDRFADAVVTSPPAPSGWQQQRIERVANGLETALSFTSRPLLDTAVRESIKELLALPPAPDASPAPTLRPNHFACPTCGPGIAVDEDGCCRTCGADAVAVVADASPAKETR